MAKEKDRRRDEKAEARKARKEAARCEAESKGKTAKKVKPKPKPKPKGMRWLNPYLTVRDVDASLAWYERAFGFKTSVTFPGPDGKPIHAEMRHRKSVLMLGPESQNARAPGKDGSPVSIYCYCEDVDAIAASARAAGAKIVEEPADQFWGDRTCFLVDPDGHQWMFATHKFEPDSTAPPPEATPQAAPEAKEGGDGAPKTATAPAAEKVAAPAAGT